VEGDSIIGKERGRIERRRVEKTKQDQYLNVLRSYWGGQPRGVRGGGLGVGVRWMIEKMCVLCQTENETIRKKRSSREDRREGLGGVQKHLPATCKVLSTPFWKKGISYWEQKRTHKAESCSAKYLWETCSGISRSCGQRKSPGGEGDMIATFFLYRRGGGGKGWVVGEEVHGSATRIRNKGQGR